MNFNRLNELKRICFKKDFERFSQFSESTGKVLNGAFEFKLMVDGFRKLDLTEMKFSTRAINSQSMKWNRGNVLGNLLSHSFKDVERKERLNAFRFVLHPCNAVYEFPFFPLERYRKKCHAVINLLHFIELRASQCSISKNYFKLVVFCALLLVV